MQGVSCWLLSAKKPPDGNIPAHWSCKRKKSDQCCLLLTAMLCFGGGDKTRTHIMDGWTHRFDFWLNFWGDYFVLGVCDQCCRGFNYEQIEVHYYVTKCVRLTFPCCYFVTVNDFIIEHLWHRGVAFPFLHTWIYVRDSAKFGVTQSFSPNVNISKNICFVKQFYERRVAEQR